MTKPKTQKVVFLVLGVVGTGSGSLTFPEDFTFDKASVAKTKAIARAKELNDEQGNTEEPVQEPDESDEDFEERMDEYEREMSDGEDEDYNPHFDFYEIEVIE